MITAAAPLRSHPAALIPLLAAALAFVIYCLVDVAKADEVRYLPRWVWAVICVISIPLGGIVYLVAGRRR